MFSTVKKTHSWAKFNVIYGELLWGMFISDGIRDNSADEDFCENNILTIIVEFEGKFVGTFVK